MFRIVSEPIAAVPWPDPGAGARVVFEGRVRNENDGRDVVRLEYEVYRDLAEAEGTKILEEAQRRFDILDCRGEHRVGALEIGDVAVRVEVLAAHRRAAFEACAWIVEEVKRRLPIWKKEHYVEGDSGWIGCEPFLGARATGSEGTGA